MTGVITRGAGGWFELDSMLDARNIRATLVSGCNTVAGLGRIFGMMTVNSASFTAGVDTDVEGKLEAAREALPHQSMVYVHIKAPDICAHDRNPRAKKEILESIDHALEPFLESNIVVAVASDHTTDSNTGRHTPDPVPALIRAPGAFQGDARALNFGESACRTGNLPRCDSHGFLLDFLKLQAD